MNKDAVIIVQLIIIGVFIAYTAPYQWMAQVGSLMCFMGAVFYPFIVRK